MKYRYLLSGLTLASLSLTAAADDAPAAAPAQTSTLTVGAGVGFGPRFAGSKENLVGFVPMLDYQRDNGFFAGTQRGVGWAGGGDALKFSLALGARGERSDKVQHVFGAGSGSQELHGMGTVKASALGLFGMSLRVSERVELNAAVDLPLTQRQNGGGLHLGAGVALLQDKQDTLTLNTRLSWGNGKYLRTYFGVTPQQSQDSGYAVYTPKAGFYEAGLNLAWSHRLDEHWGLLAMAGANHLLGDAGKSPLTRRKTAPTGGLIVAYTY